ncbi:LuxR C-terminal-related transcriptional regulator [Streptomyces sparsogenes]|uniref:LuxR C-terminal-related transcriptional regulator n=1 Tax=Streptomyces sparsogenes TaxID=67365 RepID=UPI0033F312D0
MTNPSPALTEQELAVLRRMAEGATARELAPELVMTASGAGSFMNRIVWKLGARNAPHAVHLAHSAGLLRAERHGDHAGYTAHLRRGEEPCEPCRLGERTYRNTQRAGKREAA